MVESGISKVMFLNLNSVPGVALYIISAFLFATFISLVTLAFLKPFIFKKDSTCTLEISTKELSRICGASPNLFLPFLLKVL